MHKIGILSIFFTISGCVCTHNQPEGVVRYGQAETDGQKRFKEAIQENSFENPQKKSQSTTDERRLPHLRENG